MFQGSFSNVIDGKGRVAIPARYREALAAAGEERLMLTIFNAGGVNCLDAYSPADWDELCASVQASPGEFAQDRVLFETVYLGHVHSCQPDKQGRILIPPTLRRFAELEDDVTFVGTGKKFRIFSTSGNARLMDAFQAMLRQNPGFFNRIGSDHRIGSDR